jgi:hypothetical protein
MDDFNEGRKILSYPGGMSIVENLRCDAVSFSK